MISSELVETYFNVTDFVRSHHPHSPECGIAFQARRLQEKIIALTDAYLGLYRGGVEVPERCYLARQHVVYWTIKLGVRGSSIPSPFQELFTNLELADCWAALMNRLFHVKVELKEVLVDVYDEYGFAHHESTTDLWTTQLGKRTTLQQECLWQCFTSN